MLYSALVLGLLGSFHCVGMCGPIALALPVHHHNNTQKFLKIVLYHLGRIISYGTIGYLFGLLGRGLYLSGFQQRLSILIGIFMIAYVIIPIKYLNKFKVSQPLYAVINKVKRSMGKQFQEKSNKALFTIGILNGFLPCGMIYLALVGAIETATPAEGFLYMIMYGLGTIPLMTVLLYFKDFISVSFRNKIQKAIPIFVTIIGILFILRGLGLGNPYVSPSNINLEIKKETKFCAPKEEPKFLPKK